MPFVLEFDDQEIITDNPEAIRVQAPAQGGWGSVLEVANAGRYPMTTREAARSNGRYTTEDMRWTIGRSEATKATGIAPGWRITDELGERYMVMEATWEVMGGFWNITCRNRKVVHNLRDIIEIWRGPSEARIDDQGRRREQTPERVYDNLTCRVQLMDQMADEVFGIPALRATYEIYLEEDLIDIGRSDQVRIIQKASRPGLVGAIMEITAYKNTESIDMLPVLTVTDNGARWD